VKQQPPMNNFPESRLFWKSDSRRTGPNLQTLFTYYAPGIESARERLDTWRWIGPADEPRFDASFATIDRKVNITLVPMFIATDMGMDAMECAIRICRHIGSQQGPTDWRNSDIYPGAEKP
jgi:choline dehydrogenase